MKKETIIFSIIVILIGAIFSGCFTSNTIPAIANEMENAYNSITSYKVKINETVYGYWYTEINRTIKKPDKWKIEYLAPSDSNGDIKITNANTIYDYIKSKDVWYYSTTVTESGESVGAQELQTPDFLSTLLYLINTYTIRQLDDETINTFSTTPLEFTPKDTTNAIYSKLIYWIDKETYFPVKWEIYNANKDLEREGQILSLKINIDIPASEFEPPVGVTPQMYSSDRPATLDECRLLMSLPILSPSYLPENYHLYNYTWYFRTYNYVYHSLEILYLSPDSLPVPCSVGGGSDLNWNCSNETNAISFIQSDNDIFEPPGGSYYGAEAWANAEQVAIAETTGKYGYVEYEAGDKVIFLKWYENGRYLMISIMGEPTVVNTYGTVDNLIMIGESISEQQPPDSIWVSFDGNHWVLPKN